MSFDEYNRLACKLEEVLTQLAVVDSKLVDYSLVRDTTLQNKHDIHAIVLNCAAVQKAKKEEKLPIGQTKSGIVIGVSVGIIMLAIGILIGTLGF